MEQSFSEKSQFSNSVRKNGKKIIKYSPDSNPYSKLSPIAHSPIRPGCYRRDSTDSSCSSNSSSVSSRKSRKRKTSLSSISSNENWDENNEEEKIGIRILNNNPIVISDDEEKEPTLKKKICIFLKLGRIIEKEIDKVAFKNLIHENFLKNK